MESIENQRNQIMQEPIKRQTAFKIRITNLLSGAVVADDKFKFLEFEDKKIIRVNIIANIIDKFISEGEKKFAGLTLDDASGQIRIKTFGDDIAKFEGLEIGDTILAVGVLRYFNNELYILPEILKKVDPKWLVIRKLEIGKGSEKPSTQAKKNQFNPGEVKPEKQEVNVEKIEDKEENTNNKGTGKSEIKKNILEILKTSEGGIDVDKIIMALKFDVDEINKVVTEMLEDAEVYEPKPGRIRLL